MKRRRRKPLVDRFLSKVEIRSLGSCWIWQGGTAGGNRPWDTGGPYGKLKVEGRTVYAHRLVLGLIGRRAPSREHVPHHWCRIRLCENPLHLEWVTKAKNAQLSNECGPPPRPANEGEPVW